MSEIYNWLRRTESEKKKTGRDASMAFPSGLNGESTDPAAGMDVAAPAVIDYSFTTESAIKEPDPAPEPAPEPIKLEMHSTASLNLDLTDYRVKNVWDPLTSVGEQFRLLRAKLAAIQKQRGIKTLLITSAVPGEGKTFVSCGLAGILAQQPENRVLLIDGDLRKPKAAQDLGLSYDADRSGFSDILGGKAAAMDALLSSTNSNLFFLPAGKRCENPAELLSSKLLSRSLTLFSEHFNWVVIDSPPAIAIADTSMLASVCDAVLLVSYSNRTSSKLIKDCIKRIGREKICGVIMNRSKHARSSRYYYSYYHKEPRG